MSHVRSHVAHIHEPCHMCEWVTSHIWMSHVTHMWVRHVTYMNESRHIYERVMSHICEWGMSEVKSLSWMSESMSYWKHATFRRYDECFFFFFFKCYMFAMLRSKAWHKSCGTYKWVRACDIGYMLHLKDVICVSSSSKCYMFPMLLSAELMNESCHLCEWGLSGVILHSWMSESMSYRMHATCESYVLHPLAFGVSFNLNLNLNLMLYRILMNEWVSAYYIGHMQCRKEVVFWKHVTFERYGVCFFFYPNVTCFQCWWVLHLWMGECKCMSHLKDL